MFPIDHDLHCHTHLSGCSNDPEQTPENLLAFAKAHGYTAMAFTDHFWDAPAVPGSEGTYLDGCGLEHVSADLPLPDGGPVRLVFGCETELSSAGVLGLAPEHCDRFGFIVIPPNHFHMTGFVRPEECATAEQRAELLVSRLETVLGMSLPWEKVGIAHLNCGLMFADGDLGAVLRAVPEDRFRDAMRGFAERGAGIELNMASFDANRRRGVSPEDALRLFRFARDEGCRFYLASDAHHPAGLELVPGIAPEIVEALDLDARHVYRLPEPSAIRHP